MVDVFATLTGLCSDADKWLDRDKDRAVHVNMPCNSTLIPTEQNKDHLAWKRHSDAAIKKAQQAQIDRKNRAPKTLSDLEEEDGARKGNPECVSMHEPEA